MISNRKPTSAPAEAIKDVRTILLGAGASVEAGVPAVTSMIDRMLSILRREQAQWREIEPAINVALAGMRWFAAIAHKEPLRAPDVEELFRILNDLADRKRSYLSPFIGSWNDEVVSADRSDVKALAREVTQSLVGDLNEARLKAERAGRLEKLRLPSFERTLQAALLSAAGQEPVGTFSEAANALIRALGHLCWIEDLNRVSYLSPLVKSAAREKLWIASLNYDNAIEFAAKIEGIECDLGVEGDATPIAFSLQPRPITLAKLHGSINWSLGANWGVSVEPNPARRPALLFGTGEKLRIEGPYLDLLFSFRDRLQISTTLEVCGYSFRDAHVNFLLLRWLTGDRNRTILVFDPSLTTEQIVDNLQHTLDGSRILAREWIAQRVIVQAMKAGEWIGSHYSDSD